MDSVNKEENRLVLARQLVLKGDLEEFKKDLLVAFREIAKEIVGQKPKKWMKSADVKKLLGISHSKIQTMRNAGIISFTRIGGALYYDEEDIHRMFEKNKVRSK
nr:helix-turn-helix domain-containing protein [Pedobacter sp. ASV19]